MQLLKKLKWPFFHISTEELVNFENQVSYAPWKSTVEGLELLETSVGVIELSLYFSQELRTMGLSDNC